MTTEQQHAGQLPQSGIYDRMKIAPMKTRHALLLLVLAAALPAAHAQSAKWQVVKVGKIKIN